MLEVGGADYVILQALISLVRFASVTMINLSELIYRFLDPAIHNIENAVSIPIPGWVSIVGISVSLSVYLALTWSSVAAPEEQWLQKLKTWMFVLVLAPLTLAYLLGSISVGIILWLAILGLSRVSIAVNIDKKVPMVSLVGISREKSFDFPKADEYDRIFGINLGAIIFSIVFGLYIFHYVENYIHPNLILAILISLIFITAFVGVGKHELAGIFVEAVGFSVYIALLMIIFKKYLGADWDHIIKLAFVLTALALVFAADLVRGILVDLLQKKIPSGIIGGAGECDALVVAPILTVAIIATLGPTNMLMPPGEVDIYFPGVPREVAVVGIISAYIAIFMIVLAILIGFLLMLPVLIVGTIVFNLVFGINGAVGFIDFCTLVLAPLLAIAGSSIASADRIGSDREKAIASRERSKLEKALKAIKDRAYSNVLAEFQGAGLARYQIEEIARERARGEIERFIARFVESARDPAIRRIRMKISLYYLPEESSLRRKFERELKGRKEKVDGLLKRIKARITGEKISKKHNLYF